MNELSFLPEIILLSNATRTRLVDGEPRNQPV